MTASAIQGDREKCLDSGMNNYLAKPVRAQTLKALLESYLSRTEEEKEIPTLQAEAKQIVKKALKDATKSEVDGVKTADGEKVPAVDHVSELKVERSRPPSIRTSTTQRWYQGGENGRAEENGGT